MDKETEKYYNNFFDLFRTDGWKQFQNEVVEMLNAVDSIAAARDNEDLWFRKGQLQVLTNFIALEELINRGFEEASHATDV